MSIDLATVGNATGVAGVYSLDSFDKELADAGGYVVSRKVRTSVGRGTVVVPVMSVGANPRDPGWFWFASDDRFKNWPGFGCVWPSPPKVEGAKHVPVQFLDTPMVGEREKLS